MLDALTPLQVPGAGVLAWADGDSTDLVWALPQCPSIAVAADGQPDVSLLLYRRGDDPPSGGQLTVTVDLALTQQQRAAAAAVGAARRPPPRRPDDPPPPPVEVRAPNWLDATVHAQFAAGLGADGRPSLLGDNSCLLAVQLDAAAAASVQDAWEAGFPDATVELTGTVDAATAGAAAAVGRGPTELITVAAAVRSAVGLPIHLHGPLRLPTGARTARRTDLSL